MAKKLRGYIIEKYSDMGSAYTCARLCQEAGRRGIELTLLGAMDIEVAENGLFYQKELLSPCDFVLNRYKSGSIMTALNGLAKRSYNQLEALGKYVNKYEQVKTLRSDAFEMPKYRLATLSADFDGIAGALGLPFVAKGLESSQGREVFLVQQESDYRRLREVFSEEKEWLFEQFIQASSGKDIRLYSIRGRVVGCMQRRAREGFRANVALGAEVEAFAATEWLHQAARDIYAQTELDFLGIDLLFGGNKPYFCEINVTPGIQGMERATGVNLAGLILDTIIGDF